MLMLLQLLLMMMMMVNAMFTGHRKVALVL